MLNTKIVFSKFKTTSLFYSYEKHIVEFSEDDIVILHSPNSKIYKYKILSKSIESSKNVFEIQNINSGVKGIFIFHFNGDAELKFENASTLKFKV